MDNDSELKKALVNIYRKSRLKFDYMGMGLLSEEQGNSLIGSMINKNIPFVVGRFGAVEMRLVTKFSQCGGGYSVTEKENAMYAAGIFPNDERFLNRFCEAYIQAMGSCDVLGVWETVGEKAAIKDYCKNPRLVPSRSIEPYYFSEPWSKYLRGKKVLIIHPFVETIQKQLQKSGIWENQDVLPAFEKIEVIKAVQSNAGGITEYPDWFEALDSMKERIDKKDFDIAVVGAGAYGMPLCSYIKSKGKSTIQMCGATQILFGIKGKRWDNHAIISGFYNDKWVRPAESETPPQIEKVEGGSYW
ncbi:MAG: hypothetical protein LUE16_07115 [Lachnospiraceae bacterium]|nr:hypothetical protein [Lachnospiraceae bacterium]